MGQEPTSRVRAVVDTFVGLAGRLANDHDIAELLQLLVDRCAEIMGVDTAGVLLENLDGDLRLAAATSEEMDDVEDAELSAGDGPCVESYRTREPVIVADLSECGDRWPQVVPMLLDMGMRAGHAFPLRMGDDCIGGLNLYRREPGGLDDDDIRLAQAFADFAAVGILQLRTIAKAEERADQLQHALNSRILIEQAKGMLAQRHRITPQQAWEQLRAYARNHQLRVHEVGERVIEGSAKVPISSAPHRS